MCIAKIASKVTSGIQSAHNKYVKVGSKIAQNIETIADSKLIKGDEAAKIWQDARSSAIRWQIKNTPHTPCGEHKKALESLKQYVEKMNLQGYKAVALDGPDRYDDFIMVGQKFYDTGHFSHGVAGLDKKDIDSFAELLKKLNDYGEVWFYGNPKHYPLEDIVGKNMSDLFDDIYKTQESFPLVQYEKGIKEMQKRGY